jgi:hypothetical protein
MTMFRSALLQPKCHVRSQAAQPSQSARLTILPADFGPLHWADSGPGSQNRPTPTAQNSLETTTIGTIGPIGPSPALATLTGPLTKAWPRLQADHRENDPAKVKVESSPELAALEAGRARRLHRQAAGRGPPPLVPVTFSQPARQSLGLENNGFLNGGSSDHLQRHLADDHPSVAKQSQR